MPELQEVFRMATQKVDQEPGALERQVVRQQKAERNRRVGTIATVVVLVAIGVAVFALTRREKTLPATSPFPIQNASGSMLDLGTGKLTPLPARIATSSDYYAVSPDHTLVAFNACCSTFSPLLTSNMDGTVLNRVSEDPAFNPFRDGKATDGFAAQWSPDGSMLVYQERNGATDHLGGLFVYNVVTGHRTMVTNLDQEHDWGFWAMLPSFSADGRSILFQLPRGALTGGDSQSEDLWSVPVTGGKLTLVRRNASSGHYSPDGKWLAYLSQQGALMIKSLQGGAPRQLAQGNPWWPRWSPDATRISYSENGSVYVLNIRSGTATRVADGGQAEWYDNNTLIVAHPAT